MRYFYIFTMTFLLCACSPLDAELAQDGVNIFHDMYQRGEYL